MEEKEMCGYLTCYRERGYFLRSRELVGPALAAFDTAAQRYPQDARLLTGQGLAAADAARPHQALLSAARALQLHPGNMQALSLQARALFTLGEFEKAAVVNYNGYRKRRQPPYFNEGIIACIETIENCIGAPAGRVMEDFLPLIREGEARRAAQQEADEYGLAPARRVPRVPARQEGGSPGASALRRHEALARVLAMKYLGRMADDKFFLQNLLNDHRLPSANKRGSEELVRIIKETLSSLDARQEQMRAQCPYYAIKLAEKTSSKRLTKFKTDMLQRERTHNLHIAERYLKDMNQCLKEQRTQDLMSKMERLQKFLDSKTERTLPEKEQLVDRMYRCVALGLLGLHRHSHRLSPGGMRRRVAFLMGLSSRRPRSYDSVLCNYPTRYIDVDRVLNKTLTTLHHCENDTMRCFLLYEIASLLVKQKKYDLAKFYVKKCQQLAEKVDSVAWWLNAFFVELSGNMQQGNVNEVHSAMEQARGWVGRRLGEGGQSLLHFLHCCGEVAEQSSDSSPAAEQRRRERDILRVMDQQLAAEQEQLFKRMGRVPAGRRGRVLPGGGAGGAEGAAVERRRYLQRGLSVVPGAPVPLPRPPQSKVKGHQIFEF